MGLREREAAQVLHGSADRPREGGGEPDDVATGRSVVRHIVQVPLDNCRRILDDWLPWASDEVEVELVICAQAGPEIAPGSASKPFAGLHEYGARARADFQS